MDRGWLLIAAGLMSMNSMADTVSGSAMYRERIALPPDATFEATVEDVSRADAPALVIGRISFMPAGQVPIAFEVPFDAARVEANHRYTVRTRILRDGQLMFTSTEAHLVLTGGAGRKVDMILMQRVPRTAAQAGADLIGTSWQLTRLQGQRLADVPDNRVARLTFAEDGRVSGFGGCNRFTGAYEIEGDRLTFGRIAATMRACFEGTDHETGFFKALDTVRRYAVGAGELTLRDASGAAVLGFAATDAEDEQ
jgi:putative lipoprotein